MKLCRFFKRQPRGLVLEGCRGCVPHDEEDENDRESEEGKQKTTREGVALWVGIPTDRVPLIEKRGPF